jgi:hypothetical protein
MKTEYTVYYQGFRSIHAAKAVASLYKLGIKEAHQRLLDDNQFVLSNLDDARAFGKHLVENQGSVTIGKRETPGAGESPEACSWVYIESHSHPSYNSY